MKRTGLNKLGECIEAFINHGAYKGASIESNGEKLFSYGWFVIAQWMRGDIVLRKGGVPSTTTVRQIRQLEDQLKNANIPYRYSTEESDPKASEMKAERPPSLQGLKPKGAGHFCYFQLEAIWEEWRVAFIPDYDRTMRILVMRDMTQGEAQTLCDMLNSPLNHFEKGEQ